MRKFFLTFLISIVFAVSCGVFVARADYTSEVGKQMGAAAGTQGANFSAPRDPRIIAAMIVELSLGFIGILFTCYLIYAGFLWMTAGGEEEKTKKAQKIIKYSIVGIVIILSAYSITTMVDGYLREAQQLKEDTGAFHSSFEFETDAYEPPMNSGNDPFGGDTVQVEGTVWDKL